MWGENSAKRKKDEATEKGEITKPINHKMNGKVGPDSSIHDLLFPSNTRYFITTYAEDFKWPSVHQTTVEAFSSPLNQTLAEASFPPPVPVDPVHDPANFRIKQIYPWTHMDLLGLDFVHGEKWPGSSALLQKVEYARELMLQQKMGLVEQELMLGITGNEGRETVWAQREADGLCLYKKLKTRLVEKAQVKKAQLEKAQLEKAQVKKAQVPAQEVDSDGEYA